MNHRTRSRRRFRKKRLEAAVSIERASTLSAADTHSWTPRPGPQPDAILNRPSIQPEAILDGRYRLKERISIGGMGEVWAGVHLVLGFDVALKILRSDVALDPEYRARFRREAFVMTRLRTECVARVLDCFIDASYGAVLVMELIGGANLATLFASGGWRGDEGIDLGVELTGALSRLHEAGVIHRDIKPANVILTKGKGGIDRAVIVDFGVSRLVQEGTDDDTELTSLTGAQTGVGTLQYMAPEQLLGAHHATHQADIYGVGAVLYRAMTGQYVFPHLEGTELAKAKLSRESPPLSIDLEDPVAAGLRRVLDKALQRDPKLRYASAEDMRKDLATLRNPAPLRRTLLDAVVAPGRPRLAAAAGLCIMLCVVCLLALAALKILPTAPAATVSSASTSVPPPAAKAASNP